jgi:ubiquinone/menaquinone biosynthesis C-methylase UbiE
MKSEEKEAEKNYDSVAEEYHEMRTKDSPVGCFYNELLEMPSVLELLGNVKGEKILDFGCGTGIYAKILTKKGAVVKGFDISEKMLEIAKKENSNLTLIKGSGYKIPFDEKFDIVLGALVVHYISDWDKMFKEVSRVLKNGGYFIFSTGNPVSEVGTKIKLNGKKFKIFGDYFTERKVCIPKKGAGFYHKTYETIIKTILRNNFEIVDYKDCYPDKKAKTYFPKEYARHIKEPFFNVWKVRKK